MVYGELGMFPVEMFCIQRVLCFWANLINSSSSKISYVMYKFMYNLFLNNTYRFKWLEYVKENLSALNLTSYWDNQTVNKISSFKDKLKGALVQRYKSKWQNEVFESRKCVNYRMFKKELKFEKYLTLLPCNLRISFTKFRVSNHKLPIELGRHQHIDRADRTCHLCEVVGDEYHAIFECPFFQELRIKFISKKLHFTANAEEYHTLFSDSQDIVQLCNIARMCRNIINFYK